MQRGLVTVEHQQRRRVEADQLPAQLRADRSAGAGHQHALARDVAGRGGHVGVHRVAAEEVGDVDVAQVAQAHPAVEDLVQVGQHLDLQAQRPGGVGDVAEQLGAGRGDRDDQDLGAGLLLGVPQRGAVAQHRGRPGCAGAAWRGRRRAGPPA